MMTKIKVVSFALGTTLIICTDTIAQNTVTGTGTTQTPPNKAETSGAITSPTLDQRTSLNPNGTSLPPARNPINLRRRARNFSVPSNNPGQSYQDIDQGPDYQSFPSQSTNPGPLNSTNPNP